MYFGVFCMQDLRGINQFNVYFCQSTAFLISSVTGATNYFQSGVHKIIFLHAAWPTLALYNESYTISTTPVYLHIHKVSHGLH